jgi:hypothetical protein
MFQNLQFAQLLPSGVQLARQFAGKQELGAEIRSV